MIAAEERAGLVAMNAGVELWSRDAHSEQMQRALPELKLFVPAGG